MKVTIVNQYQHDLIAKALRKILAVFGLRADLIRLSSTLDEDLGSLESDAFLILLAPYWQIQPSFILPLFKLVARASHETNLDLEDASRNDNQHVLRKCFVISVGPAPFIRPFLSLNLVEIVAALRIQSGRRDLGILQLDQTALLDLVETIASVVRHARDPRSWADFLTLLVGFRDSVAFHEIQRTIRASLASERNGGILTIIADFLNAPSRETIIKYFFPSSEALA